MFWRIFIYCNLMVKTIWNISKKHKEKVYNWEKHCCTAIRSAKIPIIPGDMFPWASLGLEEIKPGGEAKHSNWFMVLCVRKRNWSKEIWKICHFFCLNETPIISKSLFCYKTWIHSASWHHKTVLSPISLGKVNPECKWYRFVDHHVLRTTKAFGKAIKAFQIFFFSESIKFWKNNKIKFLLFFLP